MDVGINILPLLLNVTALVTFFGEDGLKVARAAGAPTGRSPNLSS